MCTSQSDLIQGGMNIAYMFSLLLAFPMCCFVFLCLYASPEGSTISDMLYTWAPCVPGVPHVDNNDKAAPSPVRPPLPSSVPAEVLCSAHLHSYSPYNTDHAG